MLWCIQAFSLTHDQAQVLAVGEGDARVEALRDAVKEADEATTRFIQALADDAVKVVAGKPVVVQDG